MHWRSFVRSCEHVASLAQLHHQLWLLLALVVAFALLDNLGKAGQVSTASFTLRRRVVRLVREHVFLFVGTLLIGYLVQGDRRISGGNTIFLGRLGVVKKLLFVVFQ